MLSRRMLLTAGFGVAAAGAFGSTLTGCAVADLPFLGDLNTEPKTPEASHPAAPNPAFSNSAGAIMAGLLTPDENLLFSPYSIGMAMALVRSGASEEIAAELDSFFGFTDRAQWESWWSSMAATLASRNGTFPGPSGENELTVTTRSANAAFVSPDVKLSQDYSSRLDTYYAAEADTVDFNDPDQAAKTINSWVDRQTDGQIEEIISPNAITPQLVLVLVNALHLVADWLTSFKTENTTEEDFHPSTGAAVPVQMMHGQAGGYYADEALEATVLFFAGKTLAMAFALPKTDLASVADAWASGGLNEMITGLETSKTSVQIDLPKWTSEWKDSLRPLLKNLGLPALFDGKSLQEMAEDAEGWKVDEVFHRAVIEVDENGVAASAATAVLLSEVSGPVESPTRLTFDRPFAYVIYDVETRVPLFIGTLNDPS